MVEYVKKIVKSHWIRRIMCSILALVMVMDIILMNFK